MLIKKAKLMKKTFIEMQGLRKREWDYCVLRKKLKKHKKCRKNENAWKKKKVDKKTDVPQKPNLIY